MEATMTQAEKKVLYPAKVHTAGGRERGVPRSDDGRLYIEHSIPDTPGTGTHSKLV